MAYTTQYGKITNEKLATLDEAIERVIICSDIPELEFFEVVGGMVAVYHKNLNQTLRARFNTVSSARRYLISKRIISVNGRESEIRISSMVPDENGNINPVCRECGAKHAGPCFSQRLSIYLFTSSR